MLQYYLFNLVLEKQIIYLCTIISLYSCLVEKKGRNQSHTEMAFATDSLQSDRQYLSCQLQSSNKGWRESWRKRREWKAGGGIDKWEKNVLFLFHELMKKDKTRYKAEYSALCYGQITESSHAYNAHIWERNGEKHVGIANQYILDHLLNTMFIWGNISLCSD